MKKSILKILSLCLSLLCLNATLKSQINCPYTITNNLNCAITVSYELLDANCLSVCGGVNSISIPANSSQNIGFGCCGNYLDIKIDVIDINGTPMGTPPNTTSGPVWASGLCGGQTSGGTCSSSCDSGGTGNWTIDTTTGACIIQ